MGWREKGKSGKEGNETQLLLRITSSNTPSRPAWVEGCLRMEMVIGRKGESETDIHTWRLVMRRKGRVCGMCVYRRCCVEIVYGIRRRVGVYEKGVT